MILNFVILKFLADIAARFAAVGHIIVILIFNGGDMTVIYSVWMPLTAIIEVNSTLSRN